VQIGWRLQAAALYKNLNSNRALRVEAAPACLSPRGASFYPAAEFSFWEREVPVQETTTTPAAAKFQASGLQRDSDPRVCFGSASYRANVAPASRHLSPFAPSGVSVTSGGTDRLSPVTQQQPGAALSRNPNDDDGSSRREPQGPWEGYAGTRSVPVATTRSPPLHAHLRPGCSLRGLRAAHPAYPRPDSRQTPHARRSRRPPHSRLYPEGKAWLGSGVGVAGSAQPRT